MILEKYDAIIVNTVHDCLVNLVPDDVGIIAACARDVITTMERIPRDWGMTEIPFKAEAEVGYRWGSCKSFNPFDEELMKGKHNGIKISEYLGVDRSRASGLLDAIEAMESE